MAPCCPSKSFDYGTVRLSKINLRRAEMKRKRNRDKEEARKNRNSEEERTKQEKIHYCLTMASFWKLDDENLVVS